MAAETKEKEHASSIEHTKSTETSRTAKRQQRLFQFRRVAERHSTTILDSSEWHNGIFFGFYVLFWVIVTMSAVRELLLNHYRTGHVLSTNIYQILRKDLWKVALMDLLMYLGMYVTYFSQLLVRDGKIDWMRTGWKLSHLWIAGYIAFFVWASRTMQLPWIGQIFLTLHALVQAMKQHSYAVFNGYMKHIKQAIATAPAGVERDELKLELRECTSNSDVNTYPSHLSLSNFFWYTMFPTCVYEVDYPRTERIRWGFVAKKLSAVFGVLFILVMISEQYLYPLATQAIKMRQAPLNYRIRAYPLYLMELFPSFAAAYMLVFYLIWDAILTAIAELTRFDDRLFYRDWWNSRSWDAYARDWNVPVHNFLLRHVYRSSIFFMKISKIQAVFLTFIFSSVIHELAMYVIFGRLRGYLLMFQMLQIPLQYLTETSIFQGNRAYGIIFFWFGMAIGPSILCTLYLMI